MARLPIGERISRLRMDAEALLSEGRAELEAAERLVMQKRAELVEIEVSLGRLTQRAHIARRPRHLLPSERDGGPSPPTRDGEEAH